jgi:hypothetical protein
MFLTVMTFLVESGSHFENAQLPVPWKSKNSASAANVVIIPEPASGKLTLYVSKIHSHVQAQPAAPQPHPSNRG